MNNSVSVEGVEEVARSLKNIELILRDNYEDIKKTMLELNANISKLNQMNGQDAITSPYPSTLTPISDGALGEILYNKQYYKYIWNIIIKGEEKTSKILTSNIMKQTDENINLLDLKEKDLELLAGKLYQFISILSSVLQVDYDGNVSNFFNSIKSNTGWVETKKIAEEAVKQKETDELYLKFRTQEGKEDYVDFFLDELGNRRYPEDMAGVYDQGTYDDRGTSKYGQWYINHFLNSEDKDISKVAYMTNDSAFCAATVTYVFVNSGNENAINPFIAVRTGAEDAINQASNGKGTWHYASDESYIPQRGDIFYRVGNGDHTGVVLGSNENYVYTIEGNTASDFKEGWDFGTVNTRVRDKSYINTGNNLSGYYTPEAYVNNTNNNVSITDETIQNKLDPTKMNNKNN